MMPFIEMVEKEVGQDVDGCSIAVNLEDGNVAVLDLMVDGLSDEEHAARVSSALRSGAVMADCDASRFIEMVEEQLKNRDGVHGEV